MDMSNLHVVQVLSATTKVDYGATVTSAKEDLVGRQDYLEPAEFPLGVNKVSIWMDFNMNWVRCDGEQVREESMNHPLWFIQED